MESPYFDISTETRKKIFNFWVQRNERFLKLLLALAGSTLAIWCVYPLVDDIEYNLMVSARFPFEYQTPVRYPMVYSSVYVAFCYSSTFVLLNDLIMQAHLMHLLCQYNILCNCFETIITDCLGENESEHSGTILTERFREKYLKKLNNLVKQHKFILDNSMEFKKSLSKPMLAQLTASGFLICFLGYQASVNADPSNAKFFMTLLYILYALFQLFIFCKWCDEIKIQSENIANSVYCSGWEKGITAIPGVRACLLLVAIRARRPVIFTAGSLFELSLASYTTIVKTSYSAVTVLRRFQ
uniref:Olfactory receptor 50 n=1 Tax=Heliconius melpomene rosina TaxID=171916 RepID=A0A1S5XXP4_HELME|nr:olfactory receptor 50 [Heliconius melpomene rosina]